MSTNRNNFTPRTSKRQGAVSVWAIVCLVFVTTVGATLARMALMGSRQMVQERRHSQADWLAESGWSLATARLQRDADYTGETWEVPATEIGGADAGRVNIKVAVAAAESQPATHEIFIVSEFPANSERKVQVTRRGTWHKSQQQ
jgi:hypothetical protein